MQNDKKKTILNKAIAKSQSDHDYDYDYDMKGYIAKYGKPDASNGKHLTDEFKLPNHITFSTDSKYSNGLTKGGVWAKKEDKKWHYAPSTYVISQHPMSELREYFKKSEPDAVLDSTTFK